MVCGKKIKRFIYIVCIFFFLRVLLGVNITFNYCFLCVFIELSFDFIFKYKCMDKNIDIVSLLVVVKSK